MKAKDPIGGILVALTIATLYLTLLVPTNTMASYNHLPLYTNCVMQVNI